MHRTLTKYDEVDIDALGEVESLEEVEDIEQESRYGKWWQVHTT